MIPIPPDFDYCFPDMTLKIELRVEYHTQVFILGFDSNFGPIEKHWWVDDCIFFLGKDSFMACLLLSRLNCIFHWWAN